MAHDTPSKVCNNNINDDTLSPNDCFRFRRFVLSKLHVINKSNVTEKVHHFLLYYSTLTEYIQVSTILGSGFTPGMWVLMTSAVISMFTSFCFV